MHEVSTHSAAPEEGRILRKKALCVPDGVTGDTQLRAPLQEGPTAGAPLASGLTGPYQSLSPTGGPASSSAHAAPHASQESDQLCSQAANARCRPTSARTWGPVLEARAHLLEAVVAPAASASAAAPTGALRSRLVCCALRALAPQVCAFLASLAVFPFSSTEMEPAVQGHVTCVTYTALQLRFW